MIIRSIIPAILLFAVVSCSDNCVNVPLTGKLRSQYRPVSPFTAIAVQSNAKVYVTIADTTTVRVEADENVVDRMTAGVRNGVLAVGTAPDFCNEGSAAMTVWVQTPSLHLIDVSGSGAVVVSGQVTGDSLTIRLSGSGTIDLDAGITVALATVISGSGTIMLRGSAANNSVSIPGSGILSGFDLSATRTTVNLPGSGTARVTAVRELHVNLPGSGLVQYRGDPTVLDVRVSGSGRVEKLR